MGIDAYIVLQPKMGVSKQKINQLFGARRDPDWLADESFAFFTGVRFYEWENSDLERRLRFTFSQMPAGLFPLVENYAVIYPDVAEYKHSETSIDIIAEDNGNLRVPFMDYTPDDKRLQEGGEKEVREIVSSVNALLALNKHLDANPAFKAIFKAHISVGQVEEIWTLIRNTPDLAGHLDAIIAGNILNYYVRENQDRA